MAEEAPPGEHDGGPSATRTLRRFLALEPDVLVLSVAMLAFSLAFQMTNRYVPEYLRVLGAGAGVIGLYGSLGNLLGALYPYPGGAVSDRVGSRSALTLFGLVSSVGFLLWFLAPTLGTLRLAGVVLPAWAWIFVGLVLTQAWGSLGLGATFALVRENVPASRLARGFASTEVFRRVGFLAGPLVAAGLLTAAPAFQVGFRAVLLVAVGVAAGGTLLQHLLYQEDAPVGKAFQGLAQVVEDLRNLPSELRPLLLGDTLVRFANGMVYVFFVIVVTQFLGVGLDVGPWSLRPDAFFGVLLAVEMGVALLVMVPAAQVAERTGLKPVVAAGFLVYAVFPVLLIHAPADPRVLVALFAFSGLRFAGLPAHKALIVGPAAERRGGTVTGSYYLLRNVLVVPSAVLGGLLYGVSPVLAFTVASLVGLLGVVLFTWRGRELPAYA